MYAIEIRDHVMIAHSLAGEAFGPAQRMHGATFVVDAAFMARTLNAHGIVVDIGLATNALHKVLGEINYRNLDEHPDFTDRLSTTERLARWVFDKLAQAIAAGELGDTGNITRLRITLHESHVARGSYEEDLGVA